MTRGIAIFLLPFGFVIAVMDAWMSIQSIVGILQPQSWPELIVGWLVGCVLTVVAVAAPALKVKNPHILLRLFWVVALVVDVGTSVVGAIWYGVMRNKPSVPVDFSQMYYDPRNAQRTLVFLAFVAILTGGCVVFGKILHQLSKKGDSGS
jgi:hypothetical protein